MASEDDQKHHLPHYHFHKTPQYAFPHVDDHAPLSAEQNASNLAKYNREHAELLAANAVSHGGHTEGDEYTPSKGAHHHAHFHLPHYTMHQTPLYFAPGSVEKPRSGAATPKNAGDGEERRSSIRVPDFLKPVEKENAPAQQSGVYDGVQGPLFQKHEGKEGS